MLTSAARPPDRGSSPRRFLLVGRRVALDFVNTISPADGAARALKDWSGLVAFLEQVGIISARRTAALLHMEQADPQTVDLLLRKSLHFRDTLRQAFEAMARGERVDRSFVEPLNDLLRVTEGHDELILENHEWNLRFIAREERPEWLLTAIARSAAETIAEGSAAPLRKCANPGCDLLFYDDSRTRRRRWCSMATCGNRSKVAAFAQRHGHRRQARR